MPHAASSWIVLAPARATATSATASASSIRSRLGRVRTTRSISTSAASATTDSLPAPVRTSSWRSARPASKAIAPAIVRSRCSAPWLPPVTRTVVRPARRPSASRASSATAARSATTETHLPPERQTGDLGADGPREPVARALERERHRRDDPRQQPVGESRHRVLLVHHRRHPERSGCQHGGDAGVAAHPEHHGRVAGRSAAPRRPNGARRTARWPIGARAPGGTGPRARRGTGSRPPARARPPGLRASR